MNRAPPSSFLLKKFMFKFSCKLLSQNKEWVIYVAIGKIKFTEEKIKCRGTGTELSFYNTQQDKIQ